MNNKKTKAVYLLTTNIIQCLAIILIFSGCARSTQDKVIPGKTLNLIIENISDGLLQGSEKLPLMRLENLQIKTSEFTNEKGQIIKWTISDISYDSERWETRYPLNQNIPRDQNGLSKGAFDVSVKFKVDENPELFGKPIELIINADLIYAICSNEPSYGKPILGIYYIEKNSTTIISNRSSISKSFQLKVLNKNEIKEMTFDSYYLIIYIIIGMMVFVTILFFLGRDKKMRNEKQISFAKYFLMSTGSGAIIILALLFKLWEWLVSGLVLALIIWLVRSCN